MLKTSDVDNIIPNTNSIHFSVNNLVNSIKFDVPQRFNSSNYLKEWSIHWYIENIDNCINKNNKDIVYDNKRNNRKLSFSYRYYANAPYAIIRSNTLFTQGNIIRTHTNPLI